jgi:transposase
MSKKELTRLEVMQRLKGKRLNQAEASEMLGISVRQVKRLYAAFRKAGAKGLVSQKQGSEQRLDQGGNRRGLICTLRDWADASA